MKKGLVFFFGVLTGILLTIGFFVARNYSQNHKGSNGEVTEQQAKLPDGVTMLDNPVPFTEAKNFQVLQVVFKDAALAQSEKDYGYGSLYYTDPIVLILADQENTFYDDQIVKAPKGSKVMQVGTYNYQTKMGWKTVPIVRFVEE